MSWPPPQPPPYYYTPSSSAPRGSNAPGSFATAGSGYQPSTGAAPDFPGQSFPNPHNASAGYYMTPQASSQAQGLYPPTENTYIPPPPTQMSYSADPNAQGPYSYPLLASPTSYQGQPMTPIASDYYGSFPAAHPNFQRWPANPNAQNTFVQGFPDAQMSSPSEPVSHNARVPDVPTMNQTSYRHQVSGPRSSEPAAQTWSSGAGAVAFSARQSQPSNSEDPGYVPPHGLAIGMPYSLQPGATSNPLPLSTEQHSSSRTSAQAGVSQSNESAHGLTPSSGYKKKWPEKATQQKLKRLKRRESPERVLGPRISERLRAAIASYVDGNEPTEELEDACLDEHHSHRSRVTKARRRRKRADESRQGGQE